MKCFVCSGKGHINQQKGRDICNECFCKQIEKRVRKFARTNEFFKKNDVILVKGALNKYFVESMLKGMPVKIVSRMNPKVKKIVMEWTLDDEANSFMSALFNGKKMKKSSKKEIKLLKVLTDKEALQFAKIRKLNFKVNAKDKDVQKFLDNIEAKHHNIKYNLLKNIEMLNRLT